MSVVVPILTCPLPDNPVIPPIDPENETIDAVQPDDPAPSPTENEAGEPVLSLNHGYKRYRYGNTNDFPTNGRVHDKQWRLRIPSGDTISENGDMTREFFLLDYFYVPFNKNKQY